jgi:short-subunit dehydrogenase
MDQSRPFAVITGASSGIGYYLARVFAENGYDLFVTADSDKINTVLRDFETFDVELDSLQVDLSTYEGVEELWSALDDTGREINAIAINAGIGVGGDFARETDLDEELKLIQLNVTSTVHLAKRVLKQLVDRDQGKILFTSSIAGDMRRPSKRFTGILRPSCNHSPNHCGAN